MFGGEISMVSKSLSRIQLDAIQVGHNIGQSLYLSSADVCQRVQTFMRRHRIVKRSRVICDCKIYSANPGIDLQHSLGHARLIRTQNSGEAIVSTINSPTVAAAIASRLVDELKQLEQEPNIDAFATAWATWRQLEGAMASEAAGRLPDPAP